MCIVILCGQTKWMMWVMYRKMNRMYGQCKWWKNLWKQNILLSQSHRSSRRSKHNVNDHRAKMSSQRTMQIQYLRCARHQNKCKKWKRSDLSRHLRPGCRPLCNYVYRNYRDYSNHRFWLDANLRRSKRQESNQSKILTHQCAYRSAHRRIILPYHQTSPIYRQRILKIHSHSGVIPRSRRQSFRRYPPLYSGVQPVQSFRCYYDLEPESNLY